MDTSNIAISNDQRSALVSADLRDWRLYLYHGGLFQRVFGVSHQSTREKAIAAAIAWVDSEEAPEESAVPA